VLLFDPYSWKRWHRGWFVGCSLVAVLALGWFVFDAITNKELPKGGSWPGLATGILGGLLMLYLFSFALRKWQPFRAYFAIKPIKFWLAQHIWFGLLTFPLVLIHGWNGIFFRFGPLTVTLLVVYAVVMLSGIYGLWRQQSVPHNLLEEIPDETIRSQIPDLLVQLRREAQLLVLATCGPTTDREGSAKALAILKENEPILKASRAGRGAGLLRILPAEPIPGTEPIRVYFNDVIEPYLTSTTTAGRLRSRLKQDFNELRGRMDPESHPVLDALEGLCDRRQQFDHQAEMHNRLHNWIIFHLTFSALLLFFLVWHLITALQYTKGTTP
jgi:hypothetical protein